MVYKILFSDNSIIELENALDYYKTKSITSLNNFKNQFNKVLDSLEINPFYQIKYKNIRAIPFNSLPFIVLFSVDEKEKHIHIYSIFNTYQSVLKYPKV